MNRAEIFCVILQRNQDFINNSTEGLTQAESVLQLPGESNCMNWVLGHIAVYRDVMLSAILKREYMRTTEAKLYAYESTPITSNSRSVQLEQLMASLKRGFETLISWLQRNPDGLLELPPHTIELDSSCGSTTEEKFAYLCWHESNHVGELHALRELALVSLGKGWK